MHAHLHVLQLARTAHLHMLSLARFATLHINARSGACVYLKNAMSSDEKQGPAREQLARLRGAQPWRHALTRREACSVSTCTPCPCRPRGCHATALCSLAS